MKYIILRLFLVSLGAFFVGAQAYSESEETAHIYETIRALAIKPRLKVMQAHLRKIRNDNLMEIPNSNPINQNAYISSKFGLRIHPVYKRKLMHWGIDFPVATGTPIRAAGGGLVLKVLNIKGKSSYGKHIIIGHDDVHASLYAHLSNVFVREGQEVERGEIIGLSGNTGVSTNPHLHFEVMKNGKRVNPIQLWREHIPSPF